MPQISVFSIATLSKKVWLFYQICPLISSGMGKNPDFIVNLYFTIKLGFSHYRHIWKSTTFLFSKWTFSVTLNGTLLINFPSISWHSFMTLNFLMDTLLIFLLFGLIWRPDYIAKRCDILVLYWAHFFLFQGTIFSLVWHIRG